MRPCRCMTSPLTCAWAGRRAGAALCPQGQCALRLLRCSIAATDSRRPPVCAAIVGGRSSIQSIAAPPTEVCQPRVQTSRRRVVCVHKPASPSHTISSQFNGFVTVKFVNGYTYRWRFTSTMTAQDGRCACCSGWRDGRAKACPEATRQYQEFLGAAKGGGFVPHPRGKFTTPAAVGVRT